MAEAITIYHNPRCSKSRQTLALLEEAGQTPTIVEYLKEPLDAAVIKTLVDSLGLSVRDIMRKNEAVYADNNLANESLSDTALIDAIIDNPILLQRPIVVRGSRAVIGRPPENVQDLL